MGLSWQPAPPDDFARLGDEGWPLADYLLRPDPDRRTALPDPDPDHPARLEALRALIAAAFGP